MTSGKVPVIAALEPAKVELEAGRKYFWCACGRSQNQPFCDGAHRGTGLEPVVVTVDEATTAFLCQCKASGNTPYCDGQHKKLGHAQPGDAVPAQD